MKSIKNMLLLAGICLGALILTSAWNVFAESGADEASTPDYEKDVVRGYGLEWSPVGTWVITAPTPMGDVTLLYSVNAQDSTGTRYSGTLKQVNANPTFFGVFPDAEAGGDIWASQTVRTGPDSFESTFLYYITKKGEGPLDETVGIGIANATWRLTGPNTNEGESTIAMYLAAQDADGDGFPDEGQEPVVCMPFTYTSKRLAMMPGHEPTPLPTQ